MLKSCFSFQVILASEAQTKRISLRNSTSKSWEWDDEFKKFYPTPSFILRKGEYMTNWKINNQSQRHLMIQEHANEISIVEPYHNGSFKILAEINLNQTSNEAQLNDENLYVSVSKEHKEINIFDKEK